jgi:hypothetical protein
MTRANYITVTQAITRNWQLITTTTSIPVVGEHAMAYDSDREVVVLYGGNATGWPYEAGTWEFDGLDWQVITPTVTPTARYGAQMAYLPGEGMILFGGSDADDTVLTRTWAYTNTDWLEIETTGPPGRTYHAMAADPISGTVYLFGGNPSTGSGQGDGADSYYNDLWAYDSGGWSIITPTTALSPSARTLADLTYDPDENRLLLFGGRSITGSLLADLWAFDFDTETWSELDGGGGGGPPGRMAHSLTYDVLAGNVVLAGGIDADETLLGDTWLYQDGWTEANPTTPLPSRAYHRAVYTDDGIILVSDGEVWKYE